VAVKNKKVSFFFVGVEAKKKKQRKTATSCLSSWCIFVDGRREIAEKAEEH
jgi:hypothetical protein